MLGREESRIPMILIQNPGYRGSTNDQQHKRVLGYGSGWDIILPAGWSMAFWIGLIYRGARAGGLREGKTSYWEQGELSFPDGFPDTEAAKQDQVTVQIVLFRSSMRFLFFFLQRMRGVLLLTKGYCTN